MSYGTIRRTSDYSFVFEMPDLVNKIKGTIPFSLISPCFKSGGRLWFINLFKSKNTLASFRLQVGGCDFSAAPITVNYALCAILGEKTYMGSSMISESFSFLESQGKVQMLGVSDFDFLASANLYLQLTFYPHKEELPLKHQLVTDSATNERSQSSSCSRKEENANVLALLLSSNIAGADSATACGSKCSSGTTAVGTQTCPTLPLNETCSSYTSGADKVLQNYKDLFLSGHDCDVTLNVEGRAFQAHKIILKCQSAVFRNMFQHEMVEQKNGIVDIEDCNSEMFQDFLLYLYTGKLEKLDSSGVVHLHYIGHKYAVEELSGTCVQFMIDNMSVESFCEYVAVGLRHSELELIEAANKFFVKNMKAIVATNAWQDFYLEYPSEAHEILNKGLDQLFK